LAAASAGAELAGRPRSFISIVLERVIAAVPAAPAKSPLPTAAATSPSFILRSPSRQDFCFQHTTMSKATIAIISD